MRRTIPFAEVAQHNCAGDCWVVIHGRVYDLTEFLGVHPGGSEIILKYAGGDASAAFAGVHPPDIVAMLADNAFLGEVSGGDGRASLEPDSQENKKSVGSDFRVRKGDSTGEEVPATGPSIKKMLRLADFEEAAISRMPREALGYITSGANDEITLRENRVAWNRLWLRPRVLVDVTSVDASSRILGFKSSMPVYISATAVNGLAHPGGEVLVTRAAHAAGVIHMLPTLSSRTLEEMTAARHPDQVQFYQLYVSSDRQRAADMVRCAEVAGCKALFITVDVPVPGRRETDMRCKGVAATLAGTTVASSATFYDPKLSWADIAWFRSITTMPIVLKGIQAGEDAVQALHLGVDGIVVSNHGGRQLDGTRSTVQVLAEVMEALRSLPGRSKMEVFVDGGIRRGTDIFKALALGAKAVGIGRPVLYGLGAFGQDGVEQ
eukprot:gene19902-23809_t